MTGADRSGHGEKLSRKQEETIAALLSTQTCASAAIDAKVNINTLTRWMRDDAGFQEAYRQARYQVLQRTIDALVQCSTLAAKALMKKLGADDVSVAAIRTALEYAFKGIEIENFRQELDALKKEIHNDAQLALPYVSHPQGLLPRHRGPLGEPPRAA